MIAGRSRLGLEEIPSERITSSGYLNDYPPPDNNLKVYTYPLASDGLRLNYNNSKLLQSVFKGGN
jgi:hypothetical protein